MSPDISKDPRILMVEYALKSLKDLTINKRYKLPSSKETTMKAIKKMNSSIKNIKYSYIPPSELAKDKRIKDFELMSEQFWNAIIKVNKDIDKHLLINFELKFIFKILKGFKKRLSLGDNVSLDKAIDIIAVRINNVSKLKNKENLYLCRVGDGEKIINVITNLQDIKKDIVIPAAILPPQDFDSEVSTAMFCSSQNMPEMNGHIGERVLNLSEEIMKEVNYQIMKLIKTL